LPTAAAPIAVPAAVAALRIGGRHRRPTAPRRRPAVLVAAALVGGLCVGTFVVANSSAEARAKSGSAVSVAHELGLTAHTGADPAPAVASRQLALLAASRAHRNAEQSAAARVRQVADAKAIAAARPTAVLPVKGGVLTSGFGYRWGTLHAGIDLAAPLGTPEYAVMDGVVLKAGPASGFGQAVYIQHANGDVTVYGHMEKILVTTGQVVKAGQEIALLGAEGQATGPHLHLEVHVGGIQGRKIDPIPWLAARGVHV
jgi:murein DD-endopeptidase MepM/ murein hydrolase activator NlpD